jgi:hypothetical protein
MFKGQYKFNTPSGLAPLYKAGDMVLNQGRIYKCVLPTQKSPLQSPSNWSFTGNSELYSSATPPINPVENQVWISDNGIAYVWFKDPNGFQWVAI